MTREKLTLLVVVLLGLDCALCAAVVWFAVRPREIVVVPGAPETRLLREGEVPDEAVRRFAVYFATNLDTFSPATFDAQARTVRALVWGRTEEFEGMLRHREEMARRAGVVSCVLIEPDTFRLHRHPRGLTAAFRATRKQFVTDRLAWEGRFEYRIEITAFPPTAANPYGLYVRSLEVRRIEHEGGS